MLDNMRGAVAANGLGAADDDETVASAADAAVACGGVCSFAPTVEDHLHGADAKRNSGALSAGEKGAGLRAGNGVGKWEGGSENGRGEGRLATGSCSVRGLSWGSVGPASIKLATEEWRPQVMGVFPFVVGERGWLERLLYLQALLPPF